MRVPQEYINNFSVGHFINHPPPDVQPNVKFVDFDLPYTFFPSYLTRFIPFMNSLPEGYEDDEVETKTKDTMRAVAIVAQETIAHGEELYADYIEDMRIEINNTPDWLIKPPPENPYLVKKEMSTRLPWPVKFIVSWEQAKRGRTYDEFEGRVIRPQIEESQLEKKPELPVNTVFKKLNE